MTYTREQVAEMMKISVEGVDALIGMKENPLPCVTIGDSVIIPGNMFEAWINGDKGRYKVSKIAINGANECDFFDALRTCLQSECADCEGQFDTADNDLLLERFMDLFKEAEA